MTSAASAAPLFVVCYDITNDRERRRVDVLLGGFGHRSQKSIFECHLTPAAYRRLKEQLEALVVTTGHIKIYRVYSGATSAVLGQAPFDPDAGYSYSI